MLMFSLLLLHTLLCTGTSSSFNFGLHRSRRGASSVVTFGDEPYQGTNTYPLDYACDGLKSTCNADFCTVVATEPTCDFIAKTVKPGAESQKCQTCTQELSDPRCTTQALKRAVHAAGGQVHAAFCTDKYLVLSATGAGSWQPNLEDIPMPPAGNGNTCRTRTWTVEGRNWKIPLVAGSGAYELLTNSHRSNNNNGNAFPQGAGDGAEKYLCTTDRGAFGLPSAGPAGVSIDGQDAFPVFNNGALLTPSWCEVDSCNEHVGQGGGPPHLHGDPFGEKCLYSQQNYTGIDGTASSINAHPPLIGWSLDGPSNYGRYLSLDAPGGRVELDECGGHTHDNMPYHYHARIQSGKANRQSRGDEALYLIGGEYQEFPAFPMGPDQCWKGDVSKQTDFWNNKNDLYAPCCSMTNYYAREGVTINGAGTLDTESYCALPSDFGLGVTGTSTDGCIIHDSLKNGKTCNVECAEGYEMSSTTSVTTFTCNKGALVAPTLQCTAKAGHTFAVTKAIPCGTNCVETTSCTAILVVETWVIVVAIIVGAIVLIVVVAVVYVKCCKKGTAATMDGTKGLAKSKEVEMADVEDGKNVASM